jgi:5-bromo-4-chloroindolyl phosphate hydrolysis protein
VGSREDRAGKNEALFREVNERIREITTYDENVEFLCECADPTCTQPIVVSISEYEMIRSDPTRFVIVAGHELPDVEDVVERTDRFAVVAKRPGRPAELAAETDPRN